MKVYQEVIWDNETCNKLIKTSKWEEVKPKGE